mmetsp:Transcript_9548/g.24429  ORF Transcript_9548/g.24429 Transcript_9548/m.24429 type:complete len:215 (-) Transcript_9548:587-1231(-)|eukprot:CAMPEP_0197489184 /NCGR_PEP_ID=MMETSP1311-20131121/4029_1 /TAXON_ID=464262 /ORGANISM="Genus nov. species nov., Strain RCC856" /LENGTH=214 /DNA_ID=CAMNT_0043033443 /DNA_START=152 /DNA_END=796 /DNA_ORIENTATION=+
MGSRFKASPLSIAVPEKAFNQWMEDETSRRRRGGGEADAPSSSTNWPNLSAITFNDLINFQGREWVEFLGLKSGLQKSYCWTKSLGQIRKRVDENVSRYLVNYIRTTMVMLCCLLCERPESLVGIIVILAILDWFSQFTAHTNLDKQSTTYQILSILVTVVVWFVVFLSKAMASVTRSVAMAGTVVGLHAALRLTQAEEQDRVKAAKKQHKKNK